MTAFAAGSAVRVVDREYFDLVLASIEGARHRIYLTMFLFDPRPVLDVNGRALDLVTALAERRDAGVDVRALLTGYVETPALGVANVAAGILLESYGVPHRRLFNIDGQRRGSHAKVVIIDDLALVGSLNWSEDAFAANVEEAVLLQGQAVDLLESEFAKLWPLGHGLPENDAR